MKIPVKTQTKIVTHLVICRSYIREDPPKMKKSKPESIKFINIATARKLMNQFNLKLNQVPSNWKFSKQP